MKQILYVLTILLIALPGFSQECVMAHDHDHQKVVIDGQEYHHCGDGHYTYIDTTGAAAARAKLAEVRSRVQTRSSNQFDRDSMPYYMLFPFDDVLLTQYSMQEIIDYTMEESVNGIIESNNCAGVQFSEFVVKFMPVDMSNNPYSSIHDITNWMAPNQPLAWLLEYKQEYDIHYLQFLTKKNASGKGTAGIVTEVFPIADKVTSVVNFKMFTLGGNTGIHEWGHNNGGDHEETASNSSITLPSARAYVGGGAHSPIKAANVISLQVNCWSGPNSYGVNYQGDTVHMYDPGIPTNNAAAIQTGMHIYRDVIDRTMVQVFGGDCGNGMISAVSNNADIWSWEVMSGNVEILSATDQPDLEYVAYEPSTVMVIGQNADKPYADTVYVDLPEIEQFSIDTLLSLGDTLQDGQVVEGPGEYQVLISGDENCDKLVTYVVQLITSVIEPGDENEIVLYPNPSEGLLEVRSSEKIDRVKVLNSFGQLIHLKMSDRHIEIIEPSAGIYFVLIESAGKLVIKKIVLTK